MKLVRILKNYAIVGAQNRRFIPNMHPDILRQTPKCEAVWDDIKFTLDPIEKCDFIIILNSPPQDTLVKCPKEHIWAIIQEPPNQRDQRGDITNSRVYTVDTSLKGRRYIQGQVALPWEVEKDYDYLISCSPPQKTRKLSSITSNLTVLEEHKERLSFIQKTKNIINFDLFGRGFNYIEDKWAGLSPYKYSLTIENFSNPYFWTEKIADCFLAWTMPIYYGCTRIADYFPKKSLVQIDIHDPMAIEKIQETIESNLWDKNLDAIAHARELVLKKYQLFPFISNEIKACKHCIKPKRLSYESITIPAKPRPPFDFAGKVINSFNKIKNLPRRRINTINN